MRFVEEAGDPEAPVPTCSPVGVLAPDPLPTVPQARSPSIQDEDSEDDLEFRTLSTLLHVLTTCRHPNTSSHRSNVRQLDEIASHLGFLDQEIKSTLRQLRDLTGALVRNHEIVAMLPKILNGGKIIGYFSVEGPGLQETAGIDTINLALNQSTRSGITLPIPLLRREISDVL